MTSAESSKAVPATSSEKKVSIIELKNGKVVCKQKPVSFEKQSETLQEIVRFREMLEERLVEQEPPLSEIPDEHKPVIVKLAHESDKGIAAIAKYIRQELLPVRDEDDEDKAKRAAMILPQSVIESAITSMLSRNNYGLDAPSGSKLSATLAVWRWEAKEEHRDWLPKSARDKAETRLEDRKEAKTLLQATFDALPQAERDAIFNTKGGDMTKKVKDSNKATTPTVSMPSEISEATVVDSAKKKGKKKAVDTNNDASAGAMTPSSKAKKAVDSEKPTKEKAAKENQIKTKSIMSFFSKTKPSTSAASSPAKSVAGGKISSQSDFERVFKPFVLKRDSTLAPINWFKGSKRRMHCTQSNAEVIIVDDDESVAGDIVMLDHPELSERELSAMTCEERLSSILASLPPSANPNRTLRTRLPYGYKVYHPTSVRDIISQLSEAEVAGDDSLVRILLAKLHDREAFPAKAFIFHEDARPGYFGTWTRSSKIIGPRRPLNKDQLVFDYGYDSGEEWEEEPVGDDVADDDDDQEEADEPDSDADSWLVDDDEEPEINLKDIDSLDMPDILEGDLPLPPPVKRKADDRDNKLSKKRKVVVPLVPYLKGPCWEETIGECSYEPFKPYRIQLFNDTPFPIDPFTYTSTCLEDYRDYRSSPNKPAGPTANNDGFVMPTLPLRLGNDTSGHSFNTPVPCIAMTNVAATSSTSVFRSNGAMPPAPNKAFRKPFPDAHLPHLVNKIVTTDTGSFNLLVELIYEELKVNKVTKAAIEAKIREVSEKVKKRWTVKAAFLTFASSPTSAPAQVGS